MMMNVTRGMKCLGLNLFLTLIFTLNSSSSIIIPHHDLKDFKPSSPTLSIKKRSLTKAEILNPKTSSSIIKLESKSPSLNPSSLRKPMETKPFQKKTKKTCGFNLFQSCFENPIKQHIKPTSNQKPMIKSFSFTSSSSSASGSSSSVSTSSSFKKLVDFPSFKKRLEVSIISAPKILDVSPETVDHAWYAWRGDQALASVLDSLDLWVFELSQRISSSSEKGWWEEEMRTSLKEGYEDPKTSSLQKGILRLILQIVEMREEGRSLREIVPEYKVHVYSLVKAFDLLTSQHHRQELLDVLQTLITTENSIKRSLGIRDALPVEDEIELQKWESVIKSIINRLAPILKSFQRLKAPEISRLESELLQLQKRSFDEKMYRFVLDLTKELIKVREDQRDEIYKTQRDRFLIDYLKPRDDEQRRSMMKRSFDLNHALAQMLRFVEDQPPILPTLAYHDEMTDEEKDSEALEVSLDEFEALRRELPSPRERPKP